tara:strand:+ start:113 stop:661 length:549 start_codon:yes stop_codon:yes gene_type:complete
MKNKAIFIEGLKIYLRPLDKKDINLNYLKWINDQKLSNHIEASRFPHTLSDLNKYYLRQKKSKNSVLFAICLKKNHKHIGNCSLTNIDWINRRAQYGRLIGVVNQETKGSGTEALKLLQYYSFKKLNLNSIWTGVSEKNISSIKSNLKAGMKKVGKFPESIFFDGKLVNMICFCLTKKQFEK